MRAKKWAIRSHRLRAKVGKNSHRSAIKLWLEALEDRTLLTTPAVIAFSPAGPGSAAIGVGVSAKISATFNEQMNVMTFSPSTFQVIDGSGHNVATPPTFNSYNTQGISGQQMTVTIDPSTPLAYSTTYSVRIVGGPSGVLDNSNPPNPMTGDVTWSFTTAPNPIYGYSGTGLPILVVTSMSNSFTSYLPEILRAEGFNDFATDDISDNNLANTLSQYNVVVLGDMTLTPNQVTIFTNWVNSGGNLIAMHPDNTQAGLSSLFGLTYANTVFPQASPNMGAYLQMNTGYLDQGQTIRSPGEGLTDQTIQYHGPADQYTIVPGSATYPVATLVTPSSVAPFPASAVQGSWSNVAPVPTTTSFEGGASLSPLDGTYTNQTLTFTSGINAGQSKGIFSYVGSSRTFTFASPWSSTPTGGDAFSIGSTTSSVIPGPTQSGSDFSFAGSVMLSALNNAYTGQTLTFTSGPNAGQSKVISSYIPSIRKFSFSSPWTSTPNGGDAFSIGPTTTSFSGTDPLSSVINAYNGQTLTFTSGINAGFSQVISGYTGSSRTFSFATAWQSAPAARDTFTIATLVPTTTSFSGGLSLSGNDNAYTNLPQTLLFTSGINAGQSRVISNYVGSSRTFSFATGFANPPTPNDAFNVVSAQSTVASSPTPTSFVGPTSLSSANNAYTGQILTFTSGLNAGKSQVVSGYTGSSRMFTFASAWANTPAINDAFYLVYPAVTWRPQTQSIVQSAPTSTSFAGDSTLSAANGSYNGWTLTFTSGTNNGISRVISTYTGNTRTFNFATAWPNPPAAGDTFKVGGQAAAFTYDLARSVVLTRQGDPSRASQDRFGLAALVGGPLPESVDLFIGHTTNLVNANPQAPWSELPDFVDLNKVAIPQADEQQRLLANLIEQMESNVMPLPRFWYLPGTTDANQNPTLLKALVVLTGDDHAPNSQSIGGTKARFDSLISDGGIQVMPQSTVQAFPTPTSTSFAGDTTLSAVNGFYAGQTLTFTSGNNKGVPPQVILSYTGNSRTFSFANPWANTPAAGDTFNIVSAQSIVQTSSSTGFTGDTTLSAVDGFYTGETVTFTSGNNKGVSKVISGYAGSSRTFGFATAWTFTPAVGDTFNVVGAQWKVQPFPSPTGTSFAGSSNLSGVEQFYTGRTLTFSSGPNAGGSQVISGYAGSTHTFSFATPWATVPPPGYTFYLGIPIRSSSYIVTPNINPPPPNPFTNNLAAYYSALGFDVGDHFYIGPGTPYPVIDPNTEAWTSFSALEQAFKDQLVLWEQTYASLPTPSTTRTHGTAWADYASDAIAEYNRRIRLDVNYYYYDVAWIKGRSGLFTGSGFPMRFANQDGTTIDTYQATTYLIDHGGLSFPSAMDTLLDDALGPLGYYGMFSVIAHNDYPPTQPTTTSFAGDASLAVDGTYTNQTLIFYNGPNAGQSRVISGYVGSSRTLSFTSPWNYAPNAGDGFSIGSTTSSVISYPVGDAMVSSAQNHNVPVVSAKQELDWADGRNGSYFSQIVWNSTNPTAKTLSFTITAAVGSTNFGGQAFGLQTLVPIHSSQTGPDLTSITLNSTTPVKFTQVTIKGIDYALFQANSGSYTLVYSTTPPTTGPVITPGSITFVNKQTVTINWTTDKGSTSHVNYFSGSVDKPALTTIHSVTLTGLTPGASYSYQITSQDFYVPSHSTTSNTFTFTNNYFKDDITARDSSGKQWVGLSTGSSFSTNIWATWPSANWVKELTGDFNGDGKTDIAALDSAGNWWVAISNGSSFAAPTIWVTWSTSVTWVDIQVGDFDGDGTADIAGRVGSAGSAAGRWWFAFSLVPGLLASPAFQNIQGPTWSTSVTWVDVHVGDFNGDGKADIVGRVGSAGSAAGQWYVSLSNGIDSSAPYGLSFTTLLWGTWSTSVTWVDVKVGDFNGDGKADIAGRTSNSSITPGQWWTGISTGSSFTNALWDTWATGVTWVDVQVGDFNGDGKADITARTSETGQWWTGISTGSSFNTTLWDTWSTGATWVDVQVGDFNGDGKADITGRYLQGGQWYTNTSNGSSFTHALWDTWATGTTWYDAQKGDFGDP